MGGIYPGSLGVERMVLTPKGSGEYIGIRLVEIICKVCTSIVNSRL